MERETLNAEDIAKIFKDLKKLPKRQVWLSSKKRPLPNIAPIAIPARAKTTVTKPAATRKAPVRTAAKPAAKPRTVKPPKAK